MQTIITLVLIILFSQLIQRMFYRRMDITPPEELDEKGFSVHTHSVHTHDEEKEEEENEENDDLE